MGGREGGKEGRKVFNVRGRQGRAVREKRGGKCEGLEL